MSDEANDNVATCLADLVTVRQLSLIWSYARSAKVDAHHECDVVMQCPVEDLSKLAAKRFIEHLQEKGRWNP